MLLISVDPSQTLGPKWFKNYQDHNNLRGKMHCYSTSDFASEM